MLLAALKGTDLMYYNVGNGSPYTVKEIVKVVEKVTGKKVHRRTAPHRAAHRAAP